MVGSAYYADQEMFFRILGLLTFNPKELQSIVSDLPKSERTLQYHDVKILLRE